MFASRALNRVICLAALVPLLMLAVSGFGYSRVRCLFTGQALDTTCCPPEAAPTTSVLRAASCCAGEGGSIVHPPAEAPSPPAPLLASRFAVADVFPPPPSLPHHRVRRTAPSADDHATPILLLKQSFLV